MNFYEFVEFSINLYHFLSLISRASRLDQIWILLYFIKIYTRFLWDLIQINKFVNQIPYLKRWDSFLSFSIFFLPGYSIEPLKEVSNFCIWCLLHTYIFHYMYVLYIEIHFFCNIMHTSIHNWSKTFFSCYNLFQYTNEWSFYTRNNFAHFTLDYDLDYDIKYIQSLYIYVFVQDIERNNNII